MKVVDASAVAAILFSESEAGAVVVRLADSRLAAPSLFWFELTNICVVKSRRESQKAAEFIAALGDRHGLAVEEMAVDHDEVASLAFASNLTGYDASYLWLALKLDAELVTLDVALAKAWARFRGPHNATPPPA